MSFLRHGESIDPMTFVPLGASGLAHSPCSSASMSSSRLFLSRLLSSRACLRFADCERFSKTKPRCTMTFQRTATNPLTRCLNPRVHSRGRPSPASAMEKPGSTWISRPLPGTEKAAPTVRMVADEVFCRLPTMGAVRGVPWLRVLRPNRRCSKSESRTAGRALLPKRILR